ncbi:alpha-glucuronidase family glycosyl hydrolase [Domibacillus enclensis]|uniref:Xylan alpha-1,2-glucuronidase n=1 Tax=Domibacillus enclensis TaxID=1017273 RepID=A0A1N6ZKH1_9BACI|nr:alpha-glucuronidase family glycosyl hydrolase [Domibacillus enclensis]OXS76727.1 alpha-glucuronidase [Domibacillus enclensis]SIR27274.1 alpha-glucuronidase [Domibacillus enclensis]
MNTIQTVQTSKSYKCWLQYDAVVNQQRKEEYSVIAKVISKQLDSPAADAAAAELKMAFESMLGIHAEVKHEKPEAGVLLSIAESADYLTDEGFEIKKEGSRLLITGKTDKGLLYGAFHLLRGMQTGEPLAKIEGIQNPANPLRMINQWDNIDGSIERGYAGASIFYENNEFTKDLGRIQDYARLLASVGINGVSINNVNVHKIETDMITSVLLPDVAKIADIFRQYGIRLFLSVNFASPIELGDLKTADPLEESVRQWWKNKAEEVYTYIPDFGGFVVKADSEHRPGPFTYGRNHADGSNMLAEALAPFGGLVIWRCFVYNCMQDWRDRKTDRARAAYDHFEPLDGQFLDNVILQIKNGPMDFQVREPVTPLFGAMPKTNQVIEFQVTQEYTGQQRHLCYLVPQWKEVLNFDTYAKGKGSAVKQVVDGSMYEYKHSGIAAVSNIGNDENWTGHTLAQANFYGYGRLTWNPELSSEDIAKEWISQTFGPDESMQQVISHMLHDSWPIYESYTAPLGVGWMVNPEHHYGPNVDGYEYSVWGTYHFADCNGIGVDRTIESGTGYTSQYFKENERYYNSIDTCPDNLLLFFHHVPYTHVLKSGETVIQHIYNTHFEGADEAANLVETWCSLKDRIDPQRFDAVLKRLEEQAEHSKQWRDRINTYFYRKSGIEDKQKRTIY